MTETILPKKLSELLLIAVEDCEKVENDPRYVLDMLEWHRPQYDGTCAVCMAGTVMASRLGADPNKDVAPFDDNTNSSQLSSIDDMRVGWFQAAAQKLDININAAVDAALARARAEVRAGYDHELQRAPFDIYRAAAAILAEVGL